MSCDTVSHTSWRMTEKCGIVGAIGPKFATDEVLLALKALEHRGNGPAGSCLLTTQGNFKRLKATSIDALQTKRKARFAQVAIGHNRYRTSASTSQRNTQPFLIRTSNGKYTLALGHNGNIPDEEVVKLRKKLQKKLPRSASDSFVLTHLLLEQRPSFKDWTTTFKKVLAPIRGAFSLVCITEEGILYAMRDQFGIRPLCLGRKDTTWFVASETVALDAIQAEVMREIAPGEMLRLENNGRYTFYRYAKPEGPEKRCLLETIYFASLHSYSGRDSIVRQRKALGAAAARRFQKKQVEVDWVVPILNSGLSVAQGAAAQLNVLLYRAIGINGKKRSFIQNTPKERRDVVYQKHIVFDPRYMSNVAGKSILLCDDSAVRGTSLENLIKRIHAFKEKGPREVHVLLGSEPVVDGCDLGVDLPDKSILLANKVGGETLEEIELNIAAFLKVDSVTYLDRVAVETALEKTSNQMCYHCFGGPHPTKN